MVARADEYVLLSNSDHENSLPGVTPKFETGENIPIRSEWRVDEAISAVDGRREAPGSGTNEQLPACETGSGDRNSAAPVVQLAEGFKEAGARAAGGQRQQPGEAPGAGERAVEAGAGEEGGGSGFLARCVAQNRGSTPALVKKVVWISSSGSLETGLKHGVELVKDGGDVLGHAFPSALFQGRDGETKFELERIL